MFKKAKNENSMNKQDDEMNFKPKKSFNFYSAAKFI